MNSWCIKQKKYTLHVIAIDGRNLCMNCLLAVEFAFHRSNYTPFIIYNINGIEENIRLMPFYPWRVAGDGWRIHWLCVCVFVVVREMRFGWQQMGYSVYSIRILHAKILMLRSTLCVCCMWQQSMYVLGTFQMCVCVCVLVECALSSQVDDALAGCAHTNTQMPEVAEVVCMHLSHFRHLRFVCATYIDSLYSRIDWLRLWKRTYRISFNASQTEHTSVCECISAVLLLLLCLRIIIINSSWSLCGWVDKNHHFLCLVWLVG